jgi:DNA repair photolyase
MNLISPFDPWGSKLCSCPVKYSLSAYTGCSHNCLYCYASSYIRNFFAVREKKDFLKRLEREIKKLPNGSLITMANSSDPYLPQEAKLKLTQGALSMLKNYAVKIIIVTKSSLILRDLKLLKDFKNLVVSFTCTTLKEKLSKKLEKSASLPKERLAAIEELSKNLTVVCRFDPLIYPLNTDEIKIMIKELKDRGVKQIITSTYKAKPDNLKRMINAFPEHGNLWHKLYALEGERSGGYIYLAKRIRKKLIEEVREITRGENLEFSSCREGFIDLNTKSCDGSSFL